MKQQFTCPPFEWGEAPPTLSGERVLLRSLHAGDAAELFAIYSDADVMRYRDGARMQTLADADTYIGSVHDYFQRRELFEWAIVDAASNRVMGTCTLLHLESRHQRVEIGFALGRPFWGHGFAREAVSLLLEFVFDRLDLHRVEADVDPRNVRSLQLMDRLGFRREGVLRERYRAEDGMQDAVLLGLLRSEWTKPAN